MLRRRVGLQPLTQRGVHTRLPAGPGGTESSEHIAVKPDRGRFLVTARRAATLFAISLNAGAHFFTRRGPVILILACALLLVTGAIALLPLFDTYAPAAPPATPDDALEAERAAVVRLIREIDSDHRAGRIAESDYQELRAQHAARGAQILRDLDAHRNAAVIPAAPARNIDAEIELAVAQQRINARTGPR